MVPLMTLLTSCDTDTSIDGITWPKTKKKLGCTLSQFSQPNKYSGAIGNAIDLTWCWCQCQVSSDWKSQVVNAFVLLMIPALASHQKSHVAPCFNHLYVANKMVPLTMLSVSIDDDTGVSSIIWPKTSCDFNCLHIMNKLIPLMMHLAPHDRSAGYNGMKWLKKSCFTSFCHCDLLNAIVPLPTLMTSQRYF